MKYGFSFLNILGLLWIFIFLVHALFNYTKFNRVEESWGVLALMVMLGIGLFILILDLALQFTINKAKTFNIVEVVISITLIPFLIKVMMEYF